MAVKTETRAVSGFDEVVLRGFGNATIIQGDDEGLTIEADEEILSRLASDVRGNKLVLGLNLEWWEWLTCWFNWVFMSDKEVRYTIRLRDFAGARISGSGKIRADDLHSSTCRFRISGAGEVVIHQLTADAVETHISGSGNIRIAGRAQTQQIRISGPGSVQNSELETLDTDIYISGSGKASVNATRNLEVGISGSGSVFYRGRPQIRKSISGAGRVGAAS